MHAAMGVTVDRKTNNREYLRSNIKMKIKILFLAANPKDSGQLRLGEEVRSIQERLRLSRERERLVFEQEWAVRVTDLQSLLLRHQPHIVHFSGHGSNAGKIILEDYAGRSKELPPDSLKKLFSTLKDNIRCVVLNACYSESQADAIAQSIDCVIGMAASIKDESGVAFSAGFYQAIGFGRSIQTAFELGCGQIDLESLGDQEVPRLISTRAEPMDTVYLLRDTQLLSEPPNP
jgi:hypothetical protein